MTRKQFECNHYKGTGYLLPIVSGDLWLCKKCYGKAEAQIKYQRNIEKDAKDR